MINPTVQSALSSQQVWNAAKAGAALIDWWTTSGKTKQFEKPFQLTRSFNSSSESIGFFDNAVIEGKKVPIMGVFENRLFDQARSSNVEEHFSQLREFVLKYMMRVSDFRPPVTIPESPETSPDFMRPINFCGDRGDSDLDGFGFTQCFYKSQNKPNVHVFAPDQRSQIVDLRLLNSTLDWLVAQVQIFDFSFSALPFGSHGPQIVVPVEESSYLLINSDFIIDDSTRSIREGNRLVGRVGFGYSFIESDKNELVGYGPGQFEAAVQHFEFQVYENGQTWVKLVFIANRPKRIVNLPIAPLDWGGAIANFSTLGVTKPAVDALLQISRELPFRFGVIDPVSIGVDLANLATGGQAAKRLCISREQLEKAFLRKHFEKHYELISNALQTWRLIPDWTAENELPISIRTGVGG